MNDELQSESYAHVSYLQEYGLTREPFATDTTSNQDEFFLLDAERAQRLNMLYHMCQNSELLLVVSGVAGSGKTSLLNKFTDMRTDNWRQCVINATSTTNPDQLLIEIAEGFGLPQDSVNFGSGLEMLQKRLTEMKRSELMPILIIDDAHELPTASLTILLKLSELSDADERLLRIVLFGEPAINDMFNAPELKEVKHRITHTLTMPSLDEKQCSEYILYRLSIAGLKEDNPFTPAQMKRIHRQANGIPGLINQYAQDILLNNTTVSNDTGNNGFAVKLRSGITILLILGIAGSITWFLSRDVIHSLGTTQDSVSSNMKTRDLPLLPPSTKLPDTSNTKLSLSTKFDALTGGVSVDAKATDNNHIDIKSPNEPTLITTASSDTVIHSTTENLEETPLPIELPKTSHIETVKEVKEVNTTLETIAKPIEAQTKPSISDIKPALTNRPAQAPKPVIKPVPVAQTNTSWLNQQNPQHFTLQLMGSRKRSSLTLVQRAHKISSESAIVRTTLKGDAWYILVYKNFASKQQAREGAKALPKALQLTKPWPRLIGDLKSVK